MSANHDAPNPRKIVDKGFLILIAATLMAALMVALQSGTAHMIGIALGALGFLAVLLPKISAGVVIAAVIPVLIPREQISRWIGHESGLRGVIFAAMAGALLPGGPSMAYPLTASLLASGADIGTSLAFVTGWSLFNLNRTLIWELSFLPPEFVTLRVLLCLPMPVLLGLAARRMATRA